ncbi:membrane protease subunit HflC [Melghiribacillus thermohalophilus]|uniref:Protein HflC n=1 Tax=Melghiribacillus thermohalophilus TaxID=1324956 RepID=A0A4R3N788_9BACI|nr:protease modulator HflC [Melghiribacillus thermohalophilus]TCT24995.1 membrane protease subunit HflC [Melghiribacillus thermohalophilus]
MTEENIIDMEQKKSFNYKSSIKNGIFLFLIIALVVLVLNSVFIVREGEYKVIRQFGEVVRIESEPGLKFKIPFIQTLTVMPNKQLIYDMDEQEINTLDKKRIIIDNYAVWTITNPQDLINNARTVANAEARMGEFIFSVVRSELGQMSYEEIINDEKSSRGDLNTRVKEAVNKSLEQNKYGIQITDVRIKRTDLPNDNEESVYQRMISERESTAQEYLSRGNAEKERIIAETDRQVKEMLSKAEREAAEIRAEGEQEAAQIYNEAFQKDEEFYRLYRTLQSYTDVVNGETTIILPHDSPYTRVLLGYFE